MMKIVIGAHSGNEGYTVACQSLSGRLLVETLSYWREALIAAHACHCGGFHGAHVGLADYCRELHGG
jgi:hypothetical protein